MAEVKIDKKGSEITLTITIPAQRVKSAFGEIRKEALKQIEAPGFRKGKAPEKVAAPHLDEDSLAEELFRELIPASYAKAVADNELKPVVPPQIQVKEFGKDKELVYEAKTAELPEVKLGNYKKAVKGLKGKVIYDSKGDSVGDDKEVTAAQVLEKLRDVAEVDIPHVVVDYEVRRMMSSLIDQVQSLGMTVDQYLSSQGKNAESIQKEYHEIAEKNLKDDFILREIAAAEKIDVSESDIEDAITAAPDEKTKAAMRQEHGRAYIEDVLLKRKTIEYLLRIVEDKK